MAPHREDLLPPDADDPSKLEPPAALTEAAEARIRALLAKRDPSGSAEQIAIALELNTTAGTELPRFAAEVFKQSRKFEVRADMLSLCGPYARDSEEAISLALRGMRDHAPKVRFRALELLAYSQREDLLPRLKAARRQIPEDSHQDVDAAIDAIEQQNPNFYRSRRDLGKLYVTPSRRF